METLALVYLDEKKQYKKVPFDDETLQKWSLFELNDQALRIAEWREAKGFSTDDTNIPEKLCLLHSEVSEALEEIRGSHIAQEVYWEGEKPCGFAIELADAYIRLLDLAASTGVDIAHAVAMKMAYNEQRPHKHDKKF